MSEKLTTLILVLSVMYPLGCSSGGKKERDSQQVPDAASAWYAAQHFVKQNLKCPSTASFGNQSWETCVSTLGNNTYRVAGWVDAQNGFGAQIRSTFVCIVLDLGTEMSCSSISISN